MHLWALSAEMVNGDPFKTKILSDTLEHQDIILLEAIVRCHNNTVQINMIMHTALQWLRQNINQSLSSQNDTP